MLLNSRVGMYIIKENEGDEILSINGVCSNDMESACSVCVCVFTSSQRNDARTGNLLHTLVEIYPLESKTDLKMLCFINKNELLIKMFTNAIKL